MEYHMTTRNYRVLLRKEPEGGYTVMVPSLPGCVTYGETVEEGIKMAQEAIELYLEADPMDIMLPPDKYKVSELAL